MTESGGPTHIVEEAMKLLAHSFGEVVPTGAQLHFLKAQRELLLGVAVIIEHNTHRSSGSGSEPTGKRRRASAKRGSGATKADAKRPARVKLS